MSRSSTRVGIKPKHFDEINDDFGNIVPIQKIRNEKDFKSVWKSLKDAGWTSKPPLGALGTLYHYLSPNVRSLEDGFENVDYFIGEDALLKYLERLNIQISDIPEEDAVLCASGDLCICDFTIVGRPAHHCRNCKKPCHSICGTTLQEGFGCDVICLKCDGPGGSAVCVVCKKGWIDQEAYLCDTCNGSCHYVCGDYLHEGTDMTCENCGLEEKEEAESKKSATFFGIFL